MAFLIDVMGEMNSWEAIVINSDLILSTSLSFVISFNTATNPFLSSS